MTYLEIANSEIMYLMTICILGFLGAQAVFFYLMARKRAKEELNISSEKLTKATKAAIISSIIPSIAIVIGLIAMAPALGVPISWARLGVIGSLMYELMVAAIGATSMGAEGIGKAGYTPQAFANSVWLMTLGIMPAFVWGVVLFRRYKEGINKATSKDKTFQSLLLNTIMVSVQVAFIVPAVFNGGNELFAFAFAAGVMLVLSCVVVKWKQNWLKEYALSFSMLAAMCAVILYNL